MSTLLGNAVVEGEKMAGGGLGPFLCTACVEASWELREFGFRLSPGKF